MVVKWNEPPEPIPSWLDPADEITDANDTKPVQWKTMSKEQLRIVFVLACFDALRSLGMTPAQALDILANAVVETGWGMYFRGWNLGGWKINKSDVTAAKARGKKLKWWRAPGNKSSKDPPWCYYQGFNSLSEFFEEWILKFLPKLGTVAVSSRYYNTGKAFWAGKNWFLELCKAGYKGVVTAANPEPSVKGHEQIKKLALVFLCQRALGVVVDGDWGSKSEKACKEKQKELGVPQTGQPSLSLL